MFANFLDFTRSPFAARPNPIARKSLPVNHEMGPERWALQSQIEMYRESGPANTASTCEGESDGD